VSSLRLAGGRLVASGTAVDTGCGAGDGKAARAGMLGRAREAADAARPLSELRRRGRSRHALILRIFSARTPRGVSNVAVPPTLAPTSALPIGESIESLPAGGSASCAETSV
jgi:hypothetical protein